MRAVFVRGRWLAASAAFLLLIGACAPPTPNQSVKNVELQSPTPSPSPTPTTAFAASGPGFHVGEVGVGYAAVALTASGGVQPYKWTVSSGALPPGLTLGADGSLSGTPASAGTFAFTIQASDSGDSSASIPGAIKVAAHLSAGLLPACAQRCNVELGCSNACGAFGQVSGGIAPYTYTLKQGPLPVGTSLAANALTLNGTFGGNSGFLQFTVQVGDAFGASATISPTFWMYPHISVAGDQSTCYRTFAPCLLRLPISGGVPNGRPSVALVRTTQQPNQGCWPPDPTPPPGYSIAVSGSYVVIDVPRPGNGYAGIWTIQVTDHTYCSSGTYCTSPSATVNIGIECT